MEVLRFSSNWNGTAFHFKIHCNYFTTFRLHNAEKYKLNEIYNIHFCDKPVKQARIIKLITAPTSNLSDMFYFLDTGYCKEKTLKMIQKMYKLSEEDLKTTLFDIILLETIKK